MRAGLKDPKRPSAVHLPGTFGRREDRDGQGISAVIFDDESALVQLDMSEYMEKNTVSRLVARLLGTSATRRGGQLTEAVRRKPFSVVLFDEIEKAHPDVFNTLLQVLEDGRLTDAHGRTVDFKNTVNKHDFEPGDRYLRRLHRLRQDRRDRNPRENEGKGTRR